MSSTQQPYIARKLCATNSGANQPADKRLVAAMAHLQAAHGDGAEARIRSMSGASLILLGERVLSEQIGKTTSTGGGDQGVYIPRTLFGG